MIKFKLLSSYNLGLRSEDRTHVQEMAMMGNPRSFYPLSGMSISSNAKISESKSLNMGYSATVSAKLSPNKIIKISSSIEITIFSVGVMFSIFQLLIN